MNVLYAIVGTLVALWLFYGCFVAYTALLYARNTGQLRRLGRLAKFLGYSYIVVGGLLDVAFNLTLGCIFFVEPPVVWTITARCQRHILNKGFRGRMARYVCEKMLDPLQEGGHC